MTNVVCAECKCSYRTARNGVEIMQTDDNGTDYALWMCDKKFCPSCGNIIYTGFGRKPLGLATDKDNTNYKTDDTTPRFK